MNCDVPNKPQARNKELEIKKLLELRRIRGIGIIAKGDEPKIIDGETFYVPSQSSKKLYKVKHIETWECECPDFQTRKLECKHIQAIKFFIKVRTSQDTDILEFNKELEQEKVKCPDCSSEDIIKRGILKTTTEQKQRYGCKKCNKRFVVQILDRTKVNAKMITLIMDLYFKGLSLRDIQGTIKQFFNVKLHHETIRRYVLKFTDKISKYTDKLNPKLSNKIHVDEQKVRTKHNEHLWSWNAIDNETRFLIANNITKERNIEDAEQIFQKVKDVTGKTENFEIVTDKLTSYPSAIGKTFYTEDWKKNFSIKHTANAGINQIHKNNNMVERYHNEFREFDKVRRGIDEVKAFNQGFRLYHNFIKENSTIGMTPSEKAGINLELGNNRWLGLLKKSLHSDGMQKA